MRKKSRWPIDQEIKDVVVDRLMRIIKDDSACDRLAIEAARTLAGLEEQNIESDFDSCDDGDDDDEWMNEWN